MLTTAPKLKQNPVVLFLLMNAGRLLCWWLQHFDIILLQLQFLNSSDSKCKNHKI